MLALSTAAFDASIFELCLPLWFGGCVAIASEQARRDPGALIKLVGDFSIDVMLATPASWQMLINYGWEGNGDLKVLCGGETMSRELADGLLQRSAEVWNLYGPTETTICSTCARVGPGKEAVPIGDVIDNTYVRILNQQMQLVPAGVAGELYIGGVGLAAGYHNQPELTRERFIADPFDDAEQLYRTGDIVRRGKNGPLMYVGRADSQIKLRGYRIEPGEVESALRSHPAVIDALVVMRGEGLSERFLEGYVMTDTRLTGEELQDHLQQSLPAYMVPSRIVTVTEFPLTPNGKIDRALLARQADQVNMSEEEMPRDDLEVKLAVIWLDVLGRDLGRNGNFFESGGNSLMAVNLLARVEQAMNVTISFGDFYEQPTIAGLADVIGRAGNHRNPGAPVSLTPNRDGRNQLFCVYGVHLYQSFARSLQDSVPVTGVYVDEDQRVAAQTTLGREASKLEETERLASRYVEIIRHAQPEGPYLLAGFSYGGMLAYEIARQLEVVGQKVSLLIMLDVPLSRRIERQKGIISFAKHASRMLLLRIWAASSGMVSLDQRRKLEADRYERRVGSYDGRVLLCRAIDESLTRRESDPTLGWSGLVKNLFVRDCPGNHIGMMSTPNVEVLAEVIREHISGLPPEPLRGDRR